MPEVGLNRDFLHRCCVQVSSALTDDAIVAAETQHILRFVRSHARNSPGEITRALVWRIVDTNDSDMEDRLGAWSVLNTVLTECADSQKPLSSTAVAEKINLFLPYLIRLRWHTSNTAASQQDNDGAGGSVSGRVALFGEYGKVVPASVVLGGEGSHSANAPRDREVQRRYRGFVETWRTVWRPDVYQRFKDAVRQVDRGANALSKSERAYLDIPATFRDSLWRLRRRSPRPSIALHVLHCFGWTPAEQPAATSNGDYAASCAAIPASATEVDALDPAAHPRVRQWMRRLVEAQGGCRRCDTWEHTELRCPCERPFIRMPLPAEEEMGGFANSHPHPRRRRAERPTMTYLEAVERLFRYDIRLPIAMDKALDRVVALIEDEMEYDELLEALDTVRGSVTGPLERHAMWIHASYKLRPSRTVFDKPSDEALSPAMERAERHFKLNRRFREWDQLLQSVEVLDSQFRRAELPQPLRQNIDEVRETKSFLFCLIDGSYTAEYNPQLYARVPEDVEKLRGVKDVLCPVCLEPFHNAARCSKGSELWDHSVARLVLEEVGLLNMRYPEDSYLIEDAIRRIDEDDRKAKEFRKNELRMAVKLVHEGRVPYCKSCGVVGHSARRCEETARRTLHHHHIKEVDMRLNPHQIQSLIRRMREEGNEREERLLSDAWELLGRGRAYPDSYLNAIRELEDAHVPLAAARYSTDAVQSFLLFIKSNDLLQHLQPLRDERFPEVCLFCDSYYHMAELCDRADAEEQGFLSELRRYGLTLWHYLRATERYDEQFPTDFPKGRDTVVRLARQFVEDYSAGGIARTRFLEANGLQSQMDDPSAPNHKRGEADAVKTTPDARRRAGRDGEREAEEMGVKQSLMTSSQRSYFGASPYGMSFSQLLLRPDRAEAEVEEEDMHLNRYNTHPPPTDRAIPPRPNGHTRLPTQEKGIPGGSEHTDPSEGQSRNENSEEDAEEEEGVEEAHWLLGGAGHGGKRGRDKDTLLAPEEDCFAGEDDGEGFPTQRMRMEEMQT